MSDLFSSNCQPKRIGIVGYYGCGNLGDETVVAILVRTLREYYPQAEILGISASPEDTVSRHAIQAFPLLLRSEAPSARKQSRLPNVEATPSFVGKLKQALKRFPILFNPLKHLKDFFCGLPGRVLAIWAELSFLQRSFHRLKGFDLLIVPGSAHLTDWWGGPWTRPYSLLKWAFLARLRGAKFIALSIGAERLSTGLGKRFCKWSLSMAQYRSFRDRYSRDSMESLGLNGDNPVFPDQGFALFDILGSKPMNTNWGKSHEPDTKLVIGVSPVAKMSCVQFGGDETSHTRYIHTMSTFLMWLLLRDYRVACCPTDMFQDQALVEQIISNIRTEMPSLNCDDRILHSPFKTTNDLIDRYQICDIIIASRFHAVVLPFALGKPVLAISYDRKVSDLMSEFGQADYHRHMDQIDLEGMTKMFLAIEKNRCSIAKHIATVVSEYRSMLNKQYKHVFESVCAVSTL